MIAEHAISIVDDGADRADLALRRETKYLFKNADVAALRHTLRLTCSPIRYAGPVSTVNSVYFDDDHLSNCQANLDGVGNRHKTRLRWYDLDRPANQFFFEIKWRRHDACGKHRLQMNSEIPIGDVAFEKTREQLARALPLQHGVHLTRDASAIVLVEYKREHFVHKYSGARLTLDYAMRFFPQIGRRCLSRRFAQPLPDMALIECKSTIGEQARLQGVLASLGARPVRFSKYVTGCHLLGYAAEL